MSERSKVDPYLLGDLRHFSSLALSKKFITRTYGFLSEDEERLSLNEGMVLPRPIRPSEAITPAHLYDMTTWVCRIGANVDGDPAIGISQRERDWKVVSRPAFVFGGVVDVFHGGHWKLATSAINLAKENNGYAYVLIESNGYVLRYKGKLPIFDEQTRSSWFRNFGPTIDGVVVWKSPESWTSGYDLLGQMMGFANKKKVFFVLPEAENSLPVKEKRILIKRRKQVEGMGFSVTIVKDTYIDISSSSIRKKFALKSTTNARDIQKS